MSFSPGPLPRSPLGLRTKPRNDSHPSDGGGAGTGFKPKRTLCSPFSLERCVFVRRPKAAEHSPVLRVPSSDFVFYSSGGPPAENTILCLTSSTSSYPFLFLMLLFFEEPTEEPSAH